MIKRLFGMLTFVLFFRFVKWGLLLGIIILVLNLGNVDLGNIKGGLSWLDEQLGESLNNFSIASSTKDNVSVNEEYDLENLPDIKGSELSSEEKEKINLWLNLNDYNRYGDPQDTFYAGGTPLFNEKTGERIDRYDYILSKRPEIIREVLE